MQPLLPATGAHARLYRWLLEKHVITGAALYITEVGRRTKPGIDIALAKYGHTYRLPVSRWRALSTTVTAALLQLAACGAAPSFDERAARRP